MRILDINNAIRTTDSNELEAFLMKRHGSGFNSFWLYLGDKEYPKLALLVKGELASLNYFPVENDAGYVSVGTVQHLPGDTTAFPITFSGGEKLDVLNEAVISFSEALQAAKEFLSSGELPQSVKWEKL